MRESYKGITSRFQRDDRISSIRSRSSFIRGRTIMSVAQNRAARRRMRFRYGGATRKRNVADIIADERRQSLKESSRKVAKK